MLLTPKVAQDRAEFLEDNAFLKDSEGNLFKSTDFHSLVRALFPTTTSVSASKLAFVVFKVMMYLGATSSASAPVEGPAATGADATDDVALYKSVLKLVCAHTGSHWATLDDGTKTVKTLINIIAPSEVSFALLHVHVTRFTMQCRPTSFAHVRRPSPCNGPCRR